MTQIVGTSFLLVSFLYVNKEEFLINSNICIFLIEFMSQLLHEKYELKASPAPKIAREEGSLISLEPICPYGSQTTEQLS